MEKKRYNIAPKGDKVFFGQLLGMSDNISYTLGQVIHFKILNLKI